MADRSYISRHDDFISLLLRSAKKRNKSLVRKILDYATTDQINALTKCIELIYSRSQDHPTKTFIHRYDSTLKKLKKSKSATAKKKILQSGGFLGALASAGPALLPQVIQGVGDGLKYLVDSNTIDVPDIISKMKRYRKRFRGGLDDA